MGRRATVALGSLGGTVTMTGDGPVDPRLGADDLAASVPGLADVADLRPVTLLRRPGASLHTDDVLAVLDWARSQVADGARGVVLVQGTDTLEETAWLLDLWWDREEPLVLTGAMRTPAAPGAEGPANLLAAVRTAAAPAARDAGAVVVMNGRVHAGSRVRKTHATALEAFTSPDSGPVGAIHEDSVWLRSRVRHAPLPAPPVASRDGGGARVALLATHLDDDGGMLRLAAGSHDAVVLAAYGAGHVSESLADVVGEVVDTVPVVVASRTGAGSTARATYGFPGSETDLVRRGALLAGWLDPLRARGLAWSVLSAGGSRGDLAHELGRRGGSPE